MLEPARNGDRSGAAMVQSTCVGLTMGDCEGGLQRRIDRGTCLHRATDRASTIMGGLPAAVIALTGRRTGNSSGDFSRLQRIGSRHRDRPSGRDRCQKICTNRATRTRGKKFFSRRRIAFPCGNLSQGKTAVEPSGSAEADVSKGCVVRRQQCIFARCGAPQPVIRRMRRFVFKRQVGRVAAFVAAYALVFNLVLRVCSSPASRQSPRLQATCFALTAVMRRKAMPTRADTRPPSTVPCVSRITSRVRFRRRRRSLSIAPTSSTAPSSRLKRGLSRGLARTTINPADRPV